MPSAFQRKSGTSRKRTPAAVVATTTPGAVGLKQTHQLPESSSSLLTSSPRINTAVAGNDALTHSPHHAANRLSKQSHQRHRPPLRGVKPWQGGTYLTSTGLNDLDNILGGGQLLGTCMLLREDRLAGTRELALTLVKYWCAEGISQGHDLIIPTFSSEKKNHRDDNDDDDPLSFLEESSSEDEYKNEESSQQHLWRNLKQELQHLIHTLPRNLHWDKERKKRDKQQKEAQAVQEAVKKADINSGLSMMSLGGPMSILEEDEEDEEEETKHDDDNLEVAWQYKTSVQQERLAKSKSTNTTASNLVLTDVFCHSYDLSARMKDQMMNQTEEDNEKNSQPSSSSTSTLDPSSYLCELAWKNENSKSSHASGYTLFYGLVQLLNEKLSTAAAAQSNDESQTPYQTKAIRLLLFHPPMPALATALPLLISHIRSKELAVVLLVVHAPPSASELSTTFKVSRSADIVLSTEGFAGRSHYPPPAEFRHLLGVLKVNKTTRKRTECAANIYGFKRDRRKLHIPLLHIPPEDYAEGGSSTSGVRSGGGKRESTSASGAISTASTTRKQSGGMGCSSNLSGSLLDF